LALSELVRMLGDIAEIAVTVLLVYAVYKIAKLVDTLNHKIEEE
jgi:hypothetical protein